jgi:hypothetical protein
MLCFFAFFEIFAVIYFCVVSKFFFLKINERIFIEKKRLELGNEMKFYESHTHRGFKWLKTPHTKTPYSSSLIDETEILLKKSLNKLDSV